MYSVYFRDRESPWVEQLARRGGKGSTIAYVKTVQENCQPQLERKQTQRQKRQLKL